MRGMNGISLLKIIRTHYTHLPVILMTACEDKKETVDALCDPRNGFLLKPFSLAELLQEIEKVSSYRILTPSSPLRVYN